MWINLNPCCYNVLLLIHITLFFFFIRRFRMLFYSYVWNSWKSLMMMMKCQHSSLNSAINWVHMKFFSADNWRWRRHTQMQKKTVILLFLMMIYFLFALHDGKISILCIQYGFGELLNQWQYDIASKIIFFCTRV